MNENRPPFLTRAFLKVLLFTVVMNGPTLPVYRTAQAAMGPIYSARVQVFVFEPFTNVRPHSMRQFLARASQKVTFVIFPRYREFADAVEKQQPDGILVRPEIAQHFGGLQPLLHSIRDGQDQENLVLLSVDRKINLENLPSSTIGILDFMGKSETRKWLDKRLDTSHAEVRTVGKIEDLITLLQFKYVEAVLVPRSYTLILQQRTRMKLVETNPGSLVLGLPILSVTNDPDRMAVILEAVMGMDSETNDALGVEKWVQMRK